MPTPIRQGPPPILSLVPPTVVEAAGGDTVAFLGTGEGCRLLEQELEKDFPDWDNMVFSIGWDRIIISSVEAQEDRDLADSPLPKELGSWDFRKRSFFAICWRAAGAG